MDTPNCPQFPQEVIDEAIRLVNEETEEERRRREFKEKLEHWRKTGSPIAIPNSFRA